jgi:phage terminase large subunit
MSAALTSRSDTLNPSAPTRISVEVETPEAFEFLFRPAQFKGVWGGRGGAKSESIARALLTYATQRPERILCCREIQASIKDSVKRLLDDCIATMNLSDLYDSTDAEIRAKHNDSLFIFAGLRNNSSSIKSMKGITKCWVEEAQTVSQASLDVLIPTIREEGSELWFSWNPENETDPVDHMFRCGCPDHTRRPEGWKPLEPPNAIVREIHWSDNPWFPESLRSIMEWDRQRDPDKYNHIWRGGYQKHSEARVFKNWRIGSRSEFNPDDRTVFYLGGDWGFSTDPSVLIRCYIEGRTLKVDREAYAVGCDIDYLPFLFGGCQDLDLQKLNENAWNSPGMTAWKGAKGIPDARKWVIVADSARPETISYMQRHGFPRIEGAKKGQGSIEDGIEFLKSYDIVVHPDCVKTSDELGSYSYKIDKLTGNVLPILVDAKNHVIDSLRYALEKVMRASMPLSSGVLVGHARPQNLQLPKVNIRKMVF